MLLLTVIGAFVLTATPVFAQEAAAPAEAMADAAHSRSLAALPGIWWVSLVGAVLALIFAWFFYRSMMSADEGDDLMKEMSGYVREGAIAYLKRQYKVVAVFFIVVSALLFVMGWFLHVQHQIVFAAFLTGGFFSGLCGWLGMNTATRASHRTTAGARKSLNDGLVVAFRSGARSWAWSSSASASSTS